MGKKTNSTKCQESSAFSSKCDHTPEVEAKTGEGHWLKTGKWQGAKNSWDRFLLLIHPQKKIGCLSPLHLLKYGHPRYNRSQQGQVDPFVKPKTKSLILEVWHSAIAAATLGTVAGPTISYTQDKFSIIKSYPSLKMCTHYLPNPGWKHKKSERKKKWQSCRYEVCNKLLFSVH